MHDERGAKRRLVVSISLSAVLLVVVAPNLLVAFQPDGTGNPQKPDSRQEVDPPVPPLEAASSAASIDRSIKFFRQRIEKNPKIVLNYIYLANYYVRKAKDHGDESCYALAQEVLEKALELQPNDPAALFSLAHVQCSRHQFREGLATAKKALNKDPNNLDTLAVLSDAQMELGEYEAATATLAAIESKVKIPSPGLWVRQAHLAEVKGQTEVVLSLLQRAEKQARKNSQGEPSTQTAWYQIRLGQFHLEHGELEEANRLLEEAVASQPDYFMARASLADLRVKQGRFDEALAEYRRTISIAADPLFFMAVGDIHAKLGRADEARQQYEQAEKLILESGATPAEFSRELSQFYSDRNLKPERALELAKTDLTFRQDIHGHDTLAWALYRNGQFAEAAKTMEQALRWGSKEAKLHYHAGMIFWRLGQADQARTHLEHALKINSNFSLLEADEARRVLAELKKS